MRRVLLLTLLCASTLVWAPSSGAVDHGDLGTMSPENQHMRFTATPIAGIYPNQAGGTNPFAAFRPPTCRTVTYCDSMQFEVSVPPEYAREVLYGVTLTLEWENPRTEDNPTGNDLDLFIWGDDGPAAGGPATKCGSPSTPECDEIYPEVYAMTEPPDTTAEDADPAAYFITVVNHSGVNTGYTLSIDWFTFELEAPPSFVPPKRGVTGQGGPTVQGPFTFDVSKPTDLDRTPKPTPRVILVPGPDGELHEVELPILATGQRLPTSAERNDTAMWIVAAAVGAVVFGILAFVLIRRSRRAAEGI